MVNTGLWNFISLVWEGVLQVLNVALYQYKVSDLNSYLVHYYPRLQALACEGGIKGMVFKFGNIICM